MLDSLKFLGAHMRCLASVAVLFALCGCTGVKTYLDKQLPPPLSEPVVRETRPKSKNGAPDGVRQAAAEEPVPAAVPASVDDFVKLAVERNPRIAKATIAIDAAQGKYLQAGLYPNPELAVNWDEIGDRTGNGIITAPKLTQTIVTGKKLTLAQAVVAKEIDQATLDLIGERYAVVGSVRSEFYDTLALQQRAALLTEVTKLADEVVKSGKTLLDNKRIAQLDLIQLEVERERFKADAQSTARELPAAYRRLAATVGNSALRVESLAGTFENLPTYDLDQIREAVLATHPDVRSAKVAVERAQAAVRRAEADPIPNLSVYTGFIRQYENKSYDGAFGVSMPVPVWNRNQGNIRSAKAELGMALQNIGQVENTLAIKVATSFQTYASARERAERFRREIIPRAEETFRLSQEAFKGGQFEYLRVLQAQRAIAEARLDLNKALGEAWKAAAELSGMLLEEAWPPLPPPKIEKEKDKDSGKP